MDTVGALLERTMHGRRLRFGPWFHAALVDAGLRSPVWSCVGHWGQCGRSCQCCDFAKGEVSGSCFACVAAAQSLPIASTIASFCCFAGETAVRALSVRWSQLPTTVVKLVGDLLPKTSLAGAVLVTTAIHPWRLTPETLFSEMRYDNPYA